MSLQINTSPKGPAVLGESVPLGLETLRLLSAGLKTLWARVREQDPGADHRPLLLSYDIHPGPKGPVLIEINTNAGGILAAHAAAAQLNRCCTDWEQGVMQQQLMALFRRDLLGDDPTACGRVAIVDDQLLQQPLYGEMQALRELMRGHAADIRLLDAAELEYSEGRLRHAGDAIDRVYWRSTDFLLQDPGHQGLRRAMEEGSTIVAPSPEAYAAIADKRRLVALSTQPELAVDASSGAVFSIAATRPLSEQTPEQWYAQRRDWVFKPASGYASRGVYVGKRISRAKLASLPAEHYLAQAYAPHPVIDRGGKGWKYDIRLFADRDQVLGVAARVFQGQVVGLRGEGSGFAPVHIDQSCCLVGAMQAARQAESATTTATRTPAP